MAGRLVPETSNRVDWPRLVAQAIKAMDLTLAAVDTRTGFSSLSDYADDTAAASGGVAIGELYRNGSVLMVRVS